jgi:hypothetical protein
VPEKQPKMVIQKSFSSTADFHAFVQGRTLYLKRAVKGSSDEAVLIVTTLDEAVEASKKSGHYFVLEDASAMREKT